MSKKKHGNLFSELADYVGDSVKYFGYDVSDGFNQHVKGPAKYYIRSAQLFCKDKISNLRADFEEAKWEAQEQGASYKGFKKYFTDKAERKANAPIEIDDGVYFMGGAEKSGDQAARSGNRKSAGCHDGGEIIDAEYTEIKASRKSRSYTP